MMKPRIFALLLLFVQFVHFGLCAILFEDYEQCREQAHFGQPNGTLVCDTESRLQPKAVNQLEGMLRDLEQNVPCDCEGGCARADRDKGEQFMALLIVSNNERIEQSGGMDALNETAKRIWDDAGMGDEHCDNGMLLIYLRDKRQMATYQGHATGHDRFKVFSDQEIANLHDLTMKAGPNGTADVSALPFGDLGNSGGGGGGTEEKESDDSVGTEVRRAAESWAPVVGLSIALALTFLVLIILLALLCAKCCRLCCPSRARKTSKYYVNPMPSYKSIEPIYIVTPAGSEAAGFAPPSGATLYGTGTYGHHHHPAGIGPTTRPQPIFHPHAIYGPPPPPPLPPAGPLVHQPHSSFRSVTPTSTQRIHRTYNPSGSGIRTAQQSIHSTPEANKRDKVNRTMTVRSNGTGTFYTATSSQQPTPDIMATAGNGGGSPKKKLSHLPDTIHETNQMPSSSIEHQQQFHHQNPSNLSSQPPPPLPFLDPWRKREVQTREEFIG